jgi:benzodiazapine receptor
VEAVARVVQGQGQLKSLRLYHVVAGKVEAKDVVKLKMASIMQGTSATTTVRQGKVRVDNAPVVKTDIAASNGAIHMIDAGINPKGKTAGVKGGARQLRPAWRRKGHSSFAPSRRVSARGAGREENGFMDSFRPWLGLAGFIGLCFAAAGIGSLLTAPALSGWYELLRKPSWNPPGWVFGPVWTALYLSLAVAAWLVWRERGLSGAALPLTLFAAQLLLNAAWSGLFFALRLPWLAFAEIVLLWGAILATLLAFWRVTPIAGWLLVPYLAWVTFAAALNLTLAQMNS